MSKKNSFKFPISQERINHFINKPNDDSIESDNLSNKTQPINITLSQKDLFILEHQIDRATKLGLRTRNRSSLIRMALRALEQVSDEGYISLYKKIN